MGSVQVKWKGKSLEAITVTGEMTVAQLKASLEGMTGVPSKNQKLLFRGAMLKDDDSSVSGLNFKDKEFIMLMGTADSSIPLKRGEEPIMDAEMASPTAAQVTGQPCGLQNLGNTCYLNSVMQFLFASLPVREACQKAQAGLEKDKTKWSLKDHLINALGSSLARMEASDTYTPIEFILCLRKCFPQFADKDDHGGYAQQDAEECLQVVTNLLHGALPDLPFQGEVMATLVKDGQTSSVTNEDFFELPCHISQETTDLTTGLEAGFTEKIVDGEGKEILKTSKVTKQPQVAMVRFTRFFWKQKEQCKAKILKKVKFPHTLSLRSISAIDGEQKEYRLRAVITHMGRSADSGHYICWAKDAKGDAWWKLDDDKVSQVKEEEIMKLDGGGDWHMAYLCLYEAVAPLAPVLIPAHDLKKMAKIPGLRANMIVLDLEDGVPPAQKAAARQNIISYTQDKSFSEISQRIAVRMNSLEDAIMIKQDAKALSAGPINNFILTKINGPKDIDTLSDLFAFRKDTNLYLTIETAQGLVNLREIASHSPLIKGLIFGAEDYCNETRIKRDRDTLLYARSAIVNQAAALRIQAIDYVCLNFRDSEALRTECEEGRRMGFHGKQAIHPDQIDIINRLFTPSQEELKRARSIVEMAETSKRQGKAAFEFDGKVVDPPVIKEALKIIQEFDEVTKTL